ncbi:4Fe-4S binding protein [Aquirufa ecclesiirivi]|nr:4Fe-4S binding protein [Aquirufa ecclesiirivi]
MNSSLALYFQNIKSAISSTRKGLALTWKHAWNARKQRTIQNIQNPDYFKSNEGVFTLQYPHQEIPTPVNGRYQLHNEMDDCIVCDKCVKVCPVDCIEIEPIKATGLVGYTSDGSPIRLYAAKFDIDMSKCCFCGLCTTVCPTECLTMTSEYDFSVFDVKEHNFSFANLSPEQAAEKKQLYEQFVAEKEALKQAAISSVEVKTEEVPVAAKPAFKPSFKAKPEASSEEVKAEEVKPVAKPAFKPSFKAKPEASSEEVKAEDVKPAPKPAFKPSFKPKAETSSEEVKAEDGKPAAKPAFKPSFKAKPEASSEEVKTEEVKPVAKPVFKPSFKPKPETSSEEVKTEEVKPVAKPAFKPSFKPKTEIPKEEKPVEEEKPAAKPAFKPSFKPKPPTTES